MTVRMTWTGSRPQTGSVGSDPSLEATTVIPSSEELWVSPSPPALPTPAIASPEVASPAVPSAEVASPAEGRRALRAARRRRRNLALGYGALIAFCLAITILIVILAGNRAPAAPGAPGAVAAAPTHLAVLD